MNLANLQTFLKIIETRSLVKASQDLHVTQSTVTARLKTLELELGQNLLLRQKSGIRLTPAGERLRRYALTMTQLWSQAKNEISLPEGINAVCNLGCHPDLWRDFGQSLFNHLQASQTARALSVWQGNRTDLDSWIRSGLTDVLISYWAAGHENIDVTPLPPDEIVLVSTEPNSPIRFDPKYVYIENGEDFGREHAKAFSDADTAKISFGNAELGLKYLLSNGGSGYLPLRVAAPFLERGRLHHLAQAPTFRRNVYLLIHPQSSAREDVLEFMNR